MEKEMPEHFPPRAGMGFFGGAGELLGVVFLPAPVALVTGVAEVMPKGVVIGYVEVSWVRRRAGGGWLTTDH